MLFLSYRRSDSRQDAERLYSALLAHFPPERVFFDSSSLHAGDDWRERIENAIDRSRVVLAVIGSKWVERFDARHAADDPVRVELETGLRLGRSILPVLVNGTTLPDPDRLPASIAPILRYQAFFLEEPYSDIYPLKVSKLVERIMSLAGILAEPLQIREHLLNKRFRHVLRELKMAARHQPLSAELKVYLATAILAGRSFNVLDSDEIAIIKKLILQALTEESPMAKAFAIAFHFDYYELRGLRSPFDYLVSELTDPSPGEWLDLASQIAIQTIALSNRTKSRLGLPPTKVSSDD